jgi:hypothetical protein
MSAVSITAANVRKGSSNDVQVEVAFVGGEAGTAGQVVYQKSTDSKWYLAQCDGTDEESGVGVRKGILLNTMVADQPVVVQTAGQITIGGTVVAGTEYVLGAAYGAVAPHADLVTGNKYTRLGYAISSSVIQLDVRATGVAVP